MTNCYMCKYYRTAGGFITSKYCFKTNPASNLSQMFPVIDFIKEVGCKSFEEEPKCPP